MKDIEKIIDKYYKGGTSEEEENILTEFLSRASEDNGDYSIEKTLIGFYKSEKQIILKSDFDEKLFNKINYNKIINNNTKKKYLIRIASIAAVLVIVLAYYLIIYLNDINLGNSKIRLTEKDKITIDLTLDALTLISDYLNLATDNMSQLSIINNSYETVHEVTQFEDYNNFINNILGIQS